MALIKDLKMARANRHYIPSETGLDLSKYARIPPSSAGRMNGLPSPMGGEG